MNGPSEDVLGECNARLHIPDDHGDNHETMRCTEAPGHPPPHREAFERGEGNRVEVTWTRDERKMCGGCSVLADLMPHCDDCQKDLCDRCFGMDEPPSCDGCWRYVCRKCMVIHECKKDA